MALWDLVGFERIVHRVMDNSIGKVDAVKSKSYRRKNKRNEMALINICLLGRQRMGSCKILMIL